VAFMGGVPMESGNVFLLSQSGANAGEVVRDLTNRGVRFSKVVSYGNGADLRAHDFLDYAAQDEESKVVAAYIEGVQDGRKFFEALQRCARVKPVIVLKGGRTQSGSQAAHSHTGSLAGSIEVFDAVCRQTGALRAETMDELQDLIVAVSTNVRQVNGRGVALFAGGGGGFAVLSADAIDREGLTVPRMPQSAVDQMREYVPVAGSSVNNPIDAFPPSEYLDDMLRLIATAEGMDMVFMSPMIDRSRWQQPNSQDKDDAKDGEDFRKKVVNEIAGQMKRLQDDTGTPVIGVIRGGGMARMMGIDSDDFLVSTYREGIGSFSSVSRAARTVTQLLQWRENRQGLPDLS